MSGGSSSVGEWCTRLEPARPPEGLARRPDDPRLGEVVEFWQGDPAALRPGRAVLIGFPQDEGVRRNHGRPGAAEAPREIRRWLYRLVPWDCESGCDLAASPPLDLGDVRIAGDLEETQHGLGEVVAAVLRSGAVPVVLGGGHETAFGHYLGYMAAGMPVGVVNVDAHLDVRPCLAGKGHSGSSFRQALEYPTHPLPGDRYACLGVQPAAVSREHWLYARERGCVVLTAENARWFLEESLTRVHDLWAKAGCRTYVSIDADVVRMSEVPGVSAPSVDGLPGADVLGLAQEAGRLPGVASLDVVEVNPRLDRDGQSSRWAALAVWHFLIGLRGRDGLRPEGTT